MEGRQSVMDRNQERVDDKWQMMLLSTFSDTPFTKICEWSSASREPPRTIFGPSPDPEKMDGRTDRRKKKNHSDTGFQTTKNTGRGERDEPSVEPRHSGGQAP